MFYFDFMFNLLLTYSLTGLRIGGGGGGGDG